MKKIMLVCAAMVTIGLFSSCDKSENSTNFQEQPDSIKMYTVEAIAVPAGSVDGIGEYNEGDTCTLEAHAYNMMYFDQWNDGIRDPIRKVVVTQDTCFRAYFLPIED